MDKPVKATVTAAGCVAAFATLLTVTPGPAAGAPPSYCPTYAAESLDRQLHPTGSGRRVVVIGDSYSLGVGLRDTTRAWTSMIPGRVQVFGFGGSGFSSAASPCGSQVAFDKRAPAALQTHPDLVLIEGGLNDAEQSAPQIRAGFRSLLKLVGNRPTLVIGPALSPARPTQAARVDAILRAESARAGKPYLSMIAEHFVYLSPRRLHIDPASHRAYAARVAAALPAQEGHPPKGTKTATAEKPPAATTPFATLRADQQPAKRRNLITPTMIGLALAAILAAGTLVRLFTSRRPPGKRRR